mmetsp:Transcript_26274/g.84991  ORF Transcript_26274/g.84991 Transcript_26274/m.84991 type:complete len:287 (+) Transcript_26274:1185-2045(+)
MVVVHVKFPGEDEFLYETTIEAGCDGVIRELVEIANARVQVAFLCGALRELAKFGPAKPTDEHGLDEIRERVGGATIDKSASYAADPSGTRTGNGVGEQLSKVFEDVCSEAERYVSKTQVALKKALTKQGLDDKLANLRGAVVMAFPMGLPKHDVVFAALESPDGLAGTGADANLLDPNTAQLWCAGKEFDRATTLAQRLGSKNEKTKIVAKLQKPGAGPPAREPVVSEQERKAMMSHYFKRQQELKDLADANDDDYLASPWANPKSLKNSLNGFNGNVIAPGVRH